MEAILFFIVVALVVVPIGFWIVLAVTGAIPGRRHR